MKKTIKIFLIGLVAILSANVAWAQQADYKKAVAKFRSYSTATATVKRIDHKAAVKTDKVSTGTAEMKKPDKMCISVNGGKDKLVMNGSTFTMVMRGRKHTTSSKNNAQFTTFQKVLESILSGGSVGGDITSLPGVTASRHGQTYTITIVPVTAKGKRMMFSSFEVTINTATSALKTLRMNQKKGNYTEYVFDDFRFGDAVSAKSFE